MTVLHLRIVVLQEHVNAWCYVCNAPSAVSVVYVLESEAEMPPAVHEVTYCELCEDR